MDKKHAIVLCSGGLDSVTTAHHVKKELNYKDIVILFFEYGQKTKEIEKFYAKKCAKEIGAKFIEISVPEIGNFSNSLINKKGNITKLSREKLKDTREEGKKWYVPHRNTIFLSYALGLAESYYMKDQKKYDIFVGFKSEGRGGFPDTSKPFMQAMSRIGNYSYGGKYKILSPFINKDKSDIIKIGGKMGLKFEDSFSCYIGKKEHCGYCMACRLRQEGFYWANIVDPTTYQVKMNDFRLAK